jgi:hypothetical protein
MSQEDLEWFRSTFRPIPKPELPDDAVEYSIYYIPSDPAPAINDETTETRSQLVEVQRSAADLTKYYLKDYIWQREGFKLEITKEDGERSLHSRNLRRFSYANSLVNRYHGATRAHKLWRLYRR